MFGAETKDQTSWWRKKVVGLEQRKPNLSWNQAIKIYDPRIQRFKQGNRYSTSKIGGWVTLTEALLKYKFENSKNMVEVLEKIEKYSRWIQRIGGKAVKANINIPLLSLYFWKDYTKLHNVECLLMNPQNK